MRAGWIAVALLAGLFLAGCTATEPPSEESPAVGDPLGQDTALEEFHFTDCFMVVLRADVPAEWVLPLVPEGFEAEAALLTDDTADIDFELYDCGEMVYNGSVETNVRFFQAGFWGFAKFSDEPDDNKLVVLEAHTNSGILAGAFVESGFAMQQADIDRLETPIFADVTNMGWAVNGDGHSFRFQFPHAYFSQGHRTYNEQFWYSGPPHSFMDLGFTADSGGFGEIDAVVIEMEGDSLTRALAGGGERFVMPAQPFWDLDLGFTLKGGYMP